MFGEGLRGRRVRLKQQNTSLHKRGGLHGSPEILLLCISQKGVHGTIFLFFYALSVGLKSGGLHVQAGF